MYRRNWQREYRAYLLFRGGPVPNLLYSDQESGLLILSHQGEQFDRRRHSASEAVESLALLHRTAADNLKAILIANEDTALSNSIALAKNRFRTRAMAAEITAVWGEDYVPISLGDLKPEHVLVHTDGYCFVDLETAVIGRPEVFDLLCLMNLYESVEQFSRLWERELSERYALNRGLRCDAVTLTAIMWGYFTEHQRTGRFWG
jgi:aminoglycoside phosphotransferase (APT) family kinase protein